MKSLPKPPELAWQFSKPFVYIVGGLALLSALVPLLVGQDPIPPLSHFLSGSLESLLPLVTLLSGLLLYYSVFYLMAGAFVLDLSILARAPDWFMGFLRRRYFDLQRHSTLPVHPVPPLSPLRLCLSQPLGLQAMGWRPGDSAQLE